MSNPIERTALHEAAHALVGELVRGRVESVTIEPERDTIGSVRFASKPAPDWERVTGNPHALISAAGMAGERIIFGSHAWGGSAIAPEEASEVFDPVDYFAGQEIDGSDLGKLCAYAKLCGFTEPEGIEHRVEAWVSEACELLASYRGQLTDLTAALLERRTLSGDEARAIIYEEILPIT